MRMDIIGKTSKKKPRKIAFSATGCLNKPFEIPIDLSKLHPSQNEHINHNIQSYDIFCSNQLKSQRNSEALTPRMMTVGFDFQHCSKCRLLDKKQFGDQQHPVTRGFQDAFEGVSLEEPGTQTHRPPKFAPSPSFAMPCSKASPLPAAV